MSQFSSKRKSENASKKAQQDNKKKQEAITQQNAILKLQRTLGNKAVIQLLMQQKNDSGGIRPQSLNLDMIDAFPPSSDPLIHKSWSTIYKQVYSYTRIIGSYKNYVDKLLAGNALMLFYQYKEGFTKGVHGLLKNTVIPNIDTLIMVLRTMASGEPEEQEEKDPNAAGHDDDDNEQKKDDKETRLEILEDLKRELERRADGQDIEEINKRLPGKDPSSSPNPAMVSFQKDIMSGAVFAQGQDAYFDAFLKKNDIDKEIFKEVVKTELQDNETRVREHMKQWLEEQQRMRDAV